MGHRKQEWAKRVRKERFKKKYLTRMQATRLLQVDAIHFRRLCILKGIYPRALERSKQKQSGNEKQYYLAREIKWLVHDHLLDRMQAHAAWEKKVRRAKSMGRADVLKLLASDKVRPRHSLVATIKERYPYFVDAVKDIDDAMSMIALYAFLSPEVRASAAVDVETHHALTSGLHERAQQVCDQWNRYVARAHSLSKGFISIKGYHYEAIVKGERVRWLVPHEYAHKFPHGIQQYVMLSFLEFYLELMKFVLAKLNADLARDEEEAQRREEEGEAAAAAAADFTATEETGAENVLVQLSSSAQQKEAAGRIALVRAELQRLRELFKGYTFYISREVPLKHARLVIESCGGRVATDFVPSNITHVVIDRPAVPPALQAAEGGGNIEYVQPQYLFDCLNARVVLPAQGYRVGEELPPHVSPFTVAISNSPEDTAALAQLQKDHPRLVSYVPERVHEIRKFINPAYTPVDPDGKVAEELLRAELEGLASDADDEGAAVPQMDAADDVSLSDEELAEARRAPEWADETVRENVERSKLSAFKVRKQRELNLMNAPTDELVARRRQVAAREREAQRRAETTDDRVRRKIAESKRQEAATKRMQLQVARKKSARYYRMVNSVVAGTQKKVAALEAKAKHLAEGKIKKSEDGTGIVNTRQEARRAEATAAGRKLKERKADNPYKKLPKWVQ